MTLECVLVKYSCVMLKKDKGVFVLLAAQSHRLD